MNNYQTMKENMSITNYPEMGKDELDSTKLYSPTELRAWKTRQVDVALAKHEAEMAIEYAQRAEQIERKRPLTEEQLYQRALSREAAKQAELATQKLLEQAKEQARSDYLASSPDIVFISESSYVLMLQQLEHWMNRKYTIDYSRITHFCDVCYEFSMSAPTKKASK